MAQKNQNDKINIKINHVSAKGIHNQAPYTRGEEIANVLTHGIGAVLAAVAFVYLVAKSYGESHVRATIAYILYAGSLLAMYLASTFYHLAKDKQLKQRLKKLDHISIYLLIAGTYSPFLLLNIGGKLGGLFFGLIWALALIGTLMKSKFAGRRIKTSVALYLAMGWLVIVLWDQMVLSVPPEAIRWLVIGGLVYSGGTIFYLLKRIRYHHMIWHLCVVVASAFHFAAVAASGFLL